MYNYYTILNFLPNFSSMQLLDDKLNDIIIIMLVFSKELVAMQFVSIRTFLFRLLNLRIKKINGLLCISLWQKTNNPNQV